MLHGNNSVEWMMTGSSTESAAAQGGDRLVVNGFYCMQSSGNVGLFTLVCPVLQANKLHSVNGWIPICRRRLWQADLVN